MRSIIKIATITLAVAFVGIQFIPPDFSDPSTNAESSIAAPTDVANVFRRSCFDCHSNETVYPWYSQIAPASWLLADHIRVGRSELNFNEWNAYSADRRSRKLDEICEQVRAGEMPLASYLWLHHSADLSDGDADLLCEWTDAEKSRIADAQPD
ncbi:MAG: heme-binding domain-containing protein [Acidobacteria bacterium]|nr:heme-binding domain-containing protein [Acidobacteriota bacterium]MCA1608050.1 heme-binding domain-containing protein [Acidobacteriota bacterium]